MPCGLCALWGGCGRLVPTRLVIPDVPVACGDQPAPRDVGPRVSIAPGVPRLPQRPRDRASTTPRHRGWAAWRAQWHPRWAGWPRGRAGPRKRAPLRASRLPLRREGPRRGDAGSRGGGPKTAGLWRDLRKRRPAWRTFVQSAEGEPPPHTAESARRPGVRWRQGRLGTPSAAGSRVVAHMRTVVAPRKQQQRLGVPDHRGCSRAVAASRQRAAVARCGVMPVCTT